MKKLIAFLKGKLEDKKVENKVKRVEIALNALEVNFKSQKDDNEIKMAELLEDFNNSEKNVEDVITDLSKAMDTIEEAERGLKRVEALREYLFTEEA